MMFVHGGMIMLIHADFTFVTKENIKSIHMKEKINKGNKQNEDRD